MSVAPRPAYGNQGHLMMIEKLIEIHITSPACGSAKVSRSPTCKNAADDTPVGGANNRSLQGQMVAMTRFAANHRGTVASHKCVRQARMVRTVAILHLQPDNEGQDRNIAE